MAIETFSSLPSVIPRTRRRNSFAHHRAGFLKRAPKPCFAPQTLHPKTRSACLLPQRSGIACLEKETILLKVMVPPPLQHSAADTLFCPGIRGVLSQVQRDVRVVLGIIV